MPQFVIPPSNTLGVKMADNTVYLPSKSGTIEVSRKHAAEIRNSKAKNRLDMIKEKSYVIAVDEENRCDKCLFAAHTFSQVCPRCNNPLKKEDK